VDLNRQFWPENPIGLEETGSALILEESSLTEGFAAFAYRAFPEHVDAIVSSTGVRDNGPAVFHQCDAALKDKVVDCVCRTVQEFLSRESIALADVSLIVPPQYPGSLGPRLAATLGFDPGRLVALDATRDYYTSSLAYAFQKMRQEGRLTPGTRALVIEIAAGLQVWCALYDA
jgi:3-oxoacyl-[acyl-carrier-protein] synthase III